MAIDDNSAERALRPIGAGGRNWLFAGSDTGEETLARAMIVIEAAKMNGLDPQAYPAEVFHRFHDHMVDRLAELLPWNWKPAIRNATRLRDGSNDLRLLHRPCRQPAGRGS